LSNLRIITISEGAAGMRSQIEGLANLIGIPYNNFNINIKPFFKNLPVQLIPARDFAYTNLKEIKIKEKTILISCGKKSVKASIFLKKKYKNLLFNIHIQDPKTQHNLFDLIICPEHDNLNKSNSISTLLALHNINFNKLPKLEDTINFIIGGSNKYFGFNEKTQKKILDEITYLSKSYKINVIPSRRTPSGLLKKLEVIKSDSIILFSNLFNPKGYGDLLSEAKLHIVTWDSISMISEAIFSESSTFVYPFENRSCPARYQNFYNSIIVKNLAKFYSRDLKTFNVSLNTYNKELKTKILNKIESNLWFRSDAS
jgi:mitochondrial fission protein ELM1